MRPAFSATQSKLIKVNICTLAAVFAGGVLSSCKMRTFNTPAQSDLQDVEKVEFERKTILSSHRFDLITASGERIFAAAKEWMPDQEKNATLFASANQHANNISRVLEMAGLTAYSSPAGSDILSAVRKSGGLIFTLPHNKQLAADQIEKVFGGKIPAGVLLSACRRENCAARSGENFWGITGDVDSNDFVLVYHNNSYRPENRPWRPYMIPLAWFRQGYSHKWMSTPWIGRQRDSRGMLTEIHPVLPQIDQFDFLNSTVSLVVLPEIAVELKKGTAVVTDGAGSIMPAKFALQNFPVADLPELGLPSDCKKLKTHSEISAFLRDKPQGNILCKFTFATPLEKVSVAGSWTEVKGVCPDGRSAGGFVFSAHVVPSCE
jgi:hypothetical protein